jgi:hypothetical protein
MANMIWCNSCNTVVWAYDEQPKYNIAGLFNEMGLPCPQCNRQHCFDGWSSNTPLNLNSMDKGVVDGWSAMRFIAKMNNKNWNPSKDNLWYIGAFEGLRNSIKRWEIRKTETQDEVELAKLDGKIDAYKWLLGEKVEGGI